MTTLASIREGDGDPRHGTSNGYSNLSCRCPRCTEAWRVKCLERMNKTRSLTPDDPRHGSRSGYCYWHCRCDDCRAANAAVNKDRADRRRQVRT